MGISKTLRPAAVILLLIFMTGSMFINSKVSEPDSSEAENEASAIDRISLYDSHQHKNKEKK